ncbi:MAG TPA: HAD-IC family P-type ATPase, partial [Gemmatimonadales bacterium]|nr:HAD-IC family P-type ATPase [Gemmatimonadales bacterium]
MTARDGAVPALRAARGGPPAWHALPASEVLKRLASRPDGLTAGEAAERLARVGLNVFEAAQPVAAWRVLVAQLRSVIVLLLALGVAVALAAGDTLDAVAIAAVLVLNTAIGFATELRAHRAMESLRALDVTRATVVREGRPRGLDARELVPGDVIELEEGHAVPADARLIQGVELTAAEASLTGEPAPVEKDAHAALPDDAPIGDRVTMVYKATTVTGGRGRAVVVATGMATEVGRIGALAAAVAPEPTPLERRLDQLGRRLAVAAVAVAAVVAALGLTQGAALADILQTAIALAVAAVPEGLPVVGTIAMAIGVRRMARRHALVRRLPVVETLGSATVICTDKTGTLTAGTMAVTVIRLLDRGVTLERALPAPDRSQTLALAPPDPRALLALRVAALANRTRTDAGSGPAAADPTEAALVAAGRAAGLDVERLRAEWPEVAEIPFSSERMLMATFHRTGEGLVACVKGAPSRVVELCDRALAPEGPRPLDQRGREQLLEFNADLAARGLRVLAVAYRELGATLDTELSGLTWIGYVGLADPPAPGVRDTIAAFAGAGIRTVMLTGDQKLTAQAVARELGLPGADREPLDGRELGRLEGSALEAAV